MQTFGEKLIASARQAEEHSAGKRKLHTSTVEVRPVPNYDPRQIQELRTRLDLTRGIFGSVVGVSSRAVESWELGERHPSASALRLIAELDANPEYVRKIVTRA